MSARAFFQRKLARIGGRSSVFYPAYGPVPIPLGLCEGVHEPTRTVIELGLTEEQMQAAVAAFDENRSFLDQLIRSPVGYSHLIDEQLSKGPAASIQQLYTIAPLLLALGPNTRLTLYKAAADLPEAPPGWWGHLNVHPWGKHFGAEMGYCSTDNQDTAEYKIVVHQEGQKEFQGFQAVAVADVNMAQVIINSDLNNALVCPWLPDYIDLHSTGAYRLDADPQMGRTWVNFKSRNGGPDIRVGICFAPLLLPLLTYGTLQLYPACVHTAFGRRMMLTRFGSWVYYGGAAQVLADMRATGIPEAPFMARTVCSIDQRMADYAGSRHRASEHLSASAIAVQQGVQSARSGALSGGAGVASALEGASTEVQAMVQAAVAGRAKEAEGMQSEE